MFNREFKTSFYKDAAPTYDQTIVKTAQGNVIQYKERVEDLNKGLHFTDFSLQSLIDADASDLLQPTQPISRDNLTVADIANSAANSIGSAIDNVSTNVEPSKDDE